jgi:hypothetical protein
VNLQRTGQLLSAFDEFQDFFRLDRVALGEAPAQHIIDEVQALVLGGMQDF